MSPLTILISGSRGLVGQALSTRLTQLGHRVIALVRDTSAPPSIPSWDSNINCILFPPEARYDAVIHLAGAGIADRRWSAARKKELRDSRILGTRALVDAIARHQTKPAVLLCASAVGIYGSRGDDLLDEQTDPDSGFLGTLAQDWEREAARASDYGIRCAQLRFGIILSPAAGALKKMLLPFKLGLGAKLGSGKQWMSWIGIDDAVAAALFILTRADLSGAFNIVSPHPVTNAEFTALLAKTLARPAFLQAPAAALRVLFGEMADAALLSSTRCTPKKLLDTGFVFSTPDLRLCLYSLLNAQ